MQIFKICLSAFFLLISFSLHSVTHYVSLGHNCQVASMLRHSQLRLAAYPFDWMGSDNFYGIITAINDDFKYFLDPLFLKYENYHILNTYYQFGYNHFFPVIGHAVNTEDLVFNAGMIVPNYLDYLPAIKITQDRRIQRFINILSSDDKVVFIRTKSHPAEACDFMNMIHLKYPQLNACLVVVHEKPELNGDWGIPNVINFYVSEKSGFGDWWKEEEWMTIFQQIATY